MKWICDCGAELELMDIDEEKGFLVSETVCPECGIVWVLRLAKREKTK